MLPGYFPLGLNVATEFRNKREWVELDVTSEGTNHSTVHFAQVLPRLVFIAFSGCFYFGIHMTCSQCFELHQSRPLWHAHKRLVFTNDINCHGMPFDCRVLPSAHLVHSLLVALLSVVWFSHHVSDWKRLVLQVVIGDNPGLLPL